jgi:hypothetical protein
MLDHVVQEQHSHALARAGPLARSESNAGAWVRTVASAWYAALLLLLLLLFLLSASSSASSSSM